MVIVAILVGGGLLGIFGMFVGVPVFAVLCTVIRNLITRTLEKKHLPVNIDSYHDMDHLDPKTLQPVFKPHTKPDPKDVFTSYTRIRSIKDDPQSQNIRQRIFKSVELSSEDLEDNNNHTITNDNNDNSFSNSEERQ